MAAEVLERVRQQLLEVERLVSPLPSSSRITLMRVYLASIQAIITAELIGSPELDRA